MKKLFYIPVLIILCGVSIYAALSFYNTKTPGEVKSQRQIADEELLRTYTSNFIVTLANEGVKLDNFKLRDSSGATFDLSTLLKKRTHQTLVFRFAETNCSSCIESALKIFKPWQDSIGTSNLIVLAAFQNNRIFNRTKQVYGIQHLNCVNSDILKLQVEEMGFPYFFVVDERGTITNVFVPNKATPHLTSQYLSAVKEKFFKT